MSRTISVDMATHLGLATTKLCTCWKIVRTDAVEKYFTDHNKAVTFDSDSYTPLMSGTPSALIQKSDLSVDNIEVDMILDSTEITEADLKNGLYDFANIYIFMVNYSTPDALGAIKLLYGKLGEIEIVDNQARTEIRSLSQEIQQTVGRVYDLMCDADLGDTRCGVTLASYTETGTVTSVTDKRVFTDSGRTEATDYFNYGKLTWTSGLNDGLTMEVKDFGSDIFTLFAPMPYDIEIGDTYSVYAGCDRRNTTCKTTFSNLVNFRGFPHVPGIDEILKGP